MEIEPRSFIRFIYPFLFDSESFDNHVECIDSAQYGTSGKAFWKSTSFPDQDMLQHAAEYLNAPVGVDPAARLWQMTTDALHSLEGMGAGRGPEWYFERRNQQTRFYIEDVQLILFRVGVGFLTMRTRLHKQVNDIATWQNFLHYFRFLRRANQRLCIRRRSIDAEGKPIEEDYFPKLGGDPARAEDSPRNAGHLVDGLLRTAALDQNADPWWKEVFIAGQFLPYAVLVFKGVTQDSQQRLLLYKAHNFFHAGQGEHPAPEELEPPQDQLLPYAERHWFVFSLDGAAFLGFDPPDHEFFRTTLPDHLDKQYLLVYLLALHQRFALMSFSDEVSRNWLPQRGAEDKPFRDKRELSFRTIRDRYLQFTARGYFTQTMQRRHHHRCYLKWQELFQNDRLFYEVGQQIREMHDYLVLCRTTHIEQLAESSRRLNLGLNVMVALFIAPALALASLSAVADSSLKETVTYTVGSFFAWVFCLALFHRWLMRGEQSPPTD